MRPVDSAEQARPLPAFVSTMLRRRKAAIFLCSDARVQGLVDPYGLTPHRNNLRRDRFSGWRQRDFPCPQAWGA